MGKVFAPELFEPKQKWLVKKYRDRVASYPEGIDPKIIADDLGLQPRTVMMIQLKLGLRKAVKAGRGGEG